MKIGDRTKAALPLITKEPVPHPPAEGAKKGAKEEGMDWMMRSNCSVLATQNLLFSAALSERSSILQRAGHPADL